MEQKGYDKLVTSVINKQTDLMRKLRDAGNMTILMALIIYTAPRKKDLIPIIRDYEVTHGKIDFDAIVDDNGMNTLMYALRTDDYNLVQFLLDRTRDLDKLDNNMHNALYYSLLDDNFTMWYNTGVVEMIINRMGKNQQNDSIKLFIERFGSDHPLMAKLNSKYNIDYLSSHNLLESKKTSEYLTADEIDMGISLLDFALNEIGEKSKLKFGHFYSIANLLKLVKNTISPRNYKMIEVLVNTKPDDSVSAVYIYCRYSKTQSTLIGYQYTYTNGIGYVTPVAPNRLNIQQCGNINPLKFYPVASLSNDQLVELLISYAVLSDITFDIPSDRMELENMVVNKLRYVEYPMFPYYESLTIYDNYAEYLIANPSVLENSDPILYDKLLAKGTIKKSGRLSKKEQVEYRNKAVRMYRALTSPVREKSRLLQFTPTTKQVGQHRLAVRRLEERDVSRDIAGIDPGPMEARAYEYNPESLEDAQKRREKYEHLTQARRALFKIEKHVGSILARKEDKQGKVTFSRQAEIEARQARLGNLPRPPIHPAREPMRTILTPEQRRQLDTSLAGPSNLSPESRYSSYSSSSSEEQLAREKISQTPIRPVTRELRDPTIGHTPYVPKTYIPRTSDLTAIRESIRKSNEYLEKTREEQRKREEEMDQRRRDREIEDQKNREYLRQAEIRENDARARQQSQTARHSSLTDTYGQLLQEFRQTGLEPRPSRPRTEHKKIMEDFLSREKQWK